MKHAIDELDMIDDNDISNFDTDNSSSLKIRMNFLLEQLKHLITTKHSRLYSILTQFISLKVYGISPAHSIFK